MPKNHSNACGCGGHHHHEEKCGCENHHDHFHAEPIGELSILQQNMLLALRERRYLPLARFAMSRAEDDEVYAIALQPVYIGSKADSLEQVTALGKELDALVHAGLVTLDYDIPLQGYRYDEYEGADVYQYFLETVKQGCEQPGALFDTAVLEKGSIALTDAGVKRAAALLE